MLLFTNRTRTSKTDIPERREAYWAGARSSYQSAVFGFHFFSPVFTVFQPKNNFKFQIGAGEDLFSTNKSKEELYLEAKHVLNLIEPYSLKSSEINGVVPRKPPRSKPEVKSVNQESVQQRVMIGTYMIHQKNSPEHTLHKNGVTNQTTTTYGYSNNEVSFISKNNCKLSKRFWILGTSDWLFTQL